MLRLLPIALVMTLSASAQQSTATQPNGDTIIKGKSGVFTVHPNGTEDATLANGDAMSLLLNGEMWLRVHDEFAILMSSDRGKHFNLPDSKGQFIAQIVYNLPESDIVGAPASEQDAVYGNCSSRTYFTAIGASFSEKWRGGDVLGDPDEDGFTFGPTRRVMAGTMMEQVFNIECKARH
jgi:hypothetical protein